MPPRLPRWLLPPSTWLPGVERARVVGATRVRTAGIAFAVAVGLSGTGVPGAAQAGLPRGNDPVPVLPPDRYARLFTDEQGLPSDVVFVLAEENDGFLWVGTAGGLTRFDGSAFTSVRPDLFGGGVHDLATSEGGRLAVVERGRRELWMDQGDGDFVPLVPTESGPPPRVAWARFDDEERLWVVLEDGSLRRREPDGRWLPRPVSGSAGRHVTRLFDNPEGGLLVAGWAGRGRPTLWRTVSPGRLERLASFPSGEILRVEAQGTGGAWVALRGPDGHRIHRVEGGTVRSTLTLPAEISGLAVRGERLYVSHAQGLEVLDAFGRVSPVRHPLESRAGGVLLVDGQGSLWSGTATGLIQFPEPSTVTWGVEHGLTSSHGEYIAVSPEGIWFSTWQGLGRLLPTPSGWQARDVQADYDATYATRLCVDRQGGVWAQTADATRRGAVLSRLDPDGPLRWEGVAGPLDCSRTPEGGIVAVAGRAVFESTPEGPPVPIAPLPAFDGAGRPWITATTDGRVLVAWYPLLCEARRADLRTGGSEVWRCGDLPDVGEIRDIAAVRGPGGRTELWLASFSGGILSRVNGVWRPVPAMSVIEQRAAMGLSPSPEGGVWAFGFGFAVRLDVREGRWQIVERLSGWHGIGGEIRSLSEEPDGTVWLASWQGITLVPPEARTGPPDPPVVRLRGLLVDGSPSEIVPPDHGAVDLVYEAGALRDPRRLRFRVALDDAPPIETGDSRQQLDGLAPGEHVVTVSASLDGQHWSPPARLAFRVRAPWYTRPWVLAFGLSFVAVVVLMRNRARTNRLIELERQRTRIAMDLHDELGAGLGSLGILGGVLASGAAPPEERSRIGAQIASTASELGGTLHEIVYSLRLGEGRLDGLVDQLVVRGRSLFSGTGVRFIGPTERPVPGVVSPAVSRQVYRIAVEALHNAARHAGAREVRLDVGLRDSPRESRGVHLTVEDDGCGIPSSGLNDSPGMGLAAMRRRAEALDAVLTIGRRPGGGTRVEIRFDPLADALLSGSDLGTTP